MGEESRPTQLVGGRARRGARTLPHSLPPTFQRGPEPLCVKPAPFPAVLPWADGLTSMGPRLLHLQSNSDDAHLVVVRPVLGMARDTSS